MMCKKRFRNLKEVFAEGPLYISDRKGEICKDLLSGYIHERVVYAQECGLENVLRSSFHFRGRERVKNQRMYQSVAFDCYLSLIRNRGVERLLSKVNSVPDLQQCLLIQYMVDEGVPFVRQNRIASAYNEMKVAHVQMKKNERRKRYLRVIDDQLKKVEGVLYRYDGIRPGWEWRRRKMMVDARMKFEKGVRFAKVGFAAWLVLYATAVGWDLMNLGEKVVDRDNSEPVVVVR